MPKKTKPISYDQAVAHLRSSQFDVQDAGAVAKTSLDRPVLVSKDGCGAIIACGPKNSVALIHKPGFIIDGEIATLLDRGFYKFLKTSKWEIAATYDRLNATHRFSEELKEIIGAISLYNESLGSINDEHMYDRLRGHNKDGQPAAGWTPWGATIAHGGHSGF